jgi:prevent-host-death family protein
MYISSVHIRIRVMSSSVNVTQLRQNLPEYLKQVREGKEVEVTVHGKVIARLVPEAAKSERAKKRLAELRKTAKVSDVTSPAGAAWTGDRDHL